MRFSLKTNWGYLSVNENGRLSFADVVGPYETFEITNLDPITPIPPTPPSGGDNWDVPAGEHIVPPAGTNYNCPRGTNFSSSAESNNFIKHGLLIAYGVWYDDGLAYWQSKKNEMLDRGPQLSMDPPELYFWERLIGRGCGPQDAAKYGPYKGLILSNDSLVE